MIEKDFGAIPGGDALRFADSLPPQNIEVEEAILGGIMLDPEALERVIDILEPEAFYINTHKDIYQACLALYSLDLPTDLLAVTNWLRDHNLLEQVGGKIKLSQLVDRTVSAVNIDALATLVMDKYLSRRLISAGTEITKMGYEQSLPILDRVDAAEAKIFAIGNKAQSDLDVESAGEICIRVFQNIESASQGLKSNIPTGFYDLDELLGGGLHPGNLIVIAGRPSMGKTAFAISLAFNIAQIHDSPTMIFSLEMSKEEVVTRFLSTISGIDSTHLREGKIENNDWEPLSRAIGLVSEAKIFIDGLPCPSPHQIRSIVRKTIAKHGQLKLVVIDYLQLMVDGSDARLVQRLGELTRQLKLLAKECNVPVIILSQLNRRLEERSNKRPIMSDIRDSGRVEEDADVILAIYRNEYYNPDSPDKSIAEISCLKQRNGPTGTVKLLFNGALSQFLNLAK